MSRYSTLAACVIGRLNVAARIAHCRHKMNIVGPADIDVNDCSSQ